MAKIICITSGLNGILNASFELIRRLKNDGHEVSYASPRRIAAKLETEGIRFIQLPPILEDCSPEIPIFTSPVRKIKRFFYKLRKYKKRRIETLRRVTPTAFASVIEDENPDLIILDIELHEYIFKTYTLKRKFVLLSQWFSLWNIKGLPYLLHDTIPGKGWRGSSFNISLSWRIVSFTRSFAFLKKKILSAGTDRRSALLMLAEYYKFPANYIKQNFWPGPFTYSELPVLSMTAFELEFPHNPRPNLFYVGPMIAENRIEKPSISFSGETLESVMEYHHTENTKLLYCSVSTLSKSDYSFIDRIIEAVSGEDNWTLIISLGSLNREKFIDVKAENVFLFPYVSQLKVMKHADISINHGGIHTINECLHFKVPMLIYSGKASDQNGCAARVAYHGVGLKADKDFDSAEDIHSKILLVLEDKDILTRVEKISSASKKYKSEYFLEKITRNLITENY